MTEIITSFANSSDNIAQCASSQSNESFNYVVCRKHPKDVFYGGSESHRTRVGFTVLQKNDGHGFVMDLNRKLELSPGKLTEKFRKKRQLLSIKSSEFKKTIEGKKRRLTYKKMRSSASSAAEKREGISYFSGSGNLDNSDLIDKVPIADYINFEDCNVVIFDIETTGFATTDEIIQLSAVFEDKTFNVHIMPRTQMSNGASDVTGIVIEGNRMYHKDNMEKEILTLSPRDALNSFLYF